LAQTKQLSPSSVRGVLTVGKSALNWAHKRGEIEQVPYIQLVKVPKPEPKGRPLEIDEVATLFRLARKEHVRVFMAFMLGTAARTSAVLELTLDQIDTANGLINLNPTGRTQTKKYRPTVKLPDQLMEYAVARGSATPQVSELVHFNGKPVKSIKTAWSKMRAESGLEGNIQTYSLRHTMARWMRMRSVPAWETAAQLGHKMPNFSTTEIYAPFDPAYLSKSKQALDDFLGEVSCELRVNSMSAFLLNPPS
jgi:integrase